MCEIIWSSVHKHLLLIFVLQSWNEISAHWAWTSCGGFCLLRFRFNLGLSLMLVFVPRALLWLKTFEKISLSKLQESCDDLRFKQRLSKLRQSLRSSYISGVYAAGWRRIMMGQIYEMDRRACKRSREKAQLGQIRLRKSHLGILAPNSHYSALSDQTCPVKKILYYMRFDPKKSQSFHSFEMIIC